MTNISSVWQVGDVTFKAVEFDEDTTLATTHAKFIGETGSFVSQEISSSTLRIRAFTQNLSSLIQELHSADILKLRRYDGYIQYVEFNRRNSRLEAPIVHDKEVELEFIAADPYKYSPNENSLSFNLDSTSKEVTINVDGEVKTPLGFAIESYRLASATKSYSSTGKSYEITGYASIKASDCDIKVLTSIPNASWFSENGILFPSYGNKSGWVWRSLDKSKKELLDFSDSKLLYNRLPIHTPYVANFIQLSSSKAVDRDIIMKINFLKMWQSFRFAGQCLFLLHGKPGGWSLSCWDNDLDDWRVVQSTIQNEGDSKFVHINNYDGSPILIGYKDDSLSTDVPYCESEIGIDQLEIGLVGYSLVCLLYTSPSPRD